MKKISSSLTRKVLIADDGRGNIDVCLRGPEAERQRPSRAHWAWVEMVAR